MVPFDGAEWYALFDDDLLDDHEELLLRCMVSCIPTSLSSSTRLISSLWTAVLSAAVRCHPPYELRAPRVHLPGSCWSA